MGGKFKCDFRHVLALKNVLCNKNTKDQTKFLSKNIWLLKSEKFKIQIMKKYSCLTFQLWVGINDNKIGCEYTVRKKHTFVQSNGVLAETAQNAQLFIVHVKAVEGLVGTIYQPFFIKNCTVESRFKKARFKKESRFKKDCCYS